MSWFEEVDHINIVVLESSPHKNGASNTLAGYFIKGAKEAGHIISVLDVAQMNIHPCSAYYVSRNTEHCTIFHDDMHLVEAALVEADMIVYVTPVYFYDMSAQLKTVIDRLHCFYAKLQGMKSLLLATAWRTDDEVMSYLDNLYNGLARYLKYRNLGSIMAKGCGNAETVKNSLYAKNAYELGRSLK